MRATRRSARLLARGFCPACADLMCFDCRLAHESCKCACAGQSIRPKAQRQPLRMTHRNETLTLDDFRHYADLTAGGNLFRLRSQLRHLARDKQRHRPKRQKAWTDYQDLSAYLGQPIGEPRV